jgi:Fuc2NAc and GlcNAc transferase
VTISLLVAAGAALTVAAMVSWIISLFGARIGLLDVPNARSSHRSPTPRGGGIGIVAGVLIGTTLLTLTGRPVAGSVIVVLAGSLAIATLGLLDDLRSIPIIYRLVGQCAIAIAVVALVGAVDRLPLPQPLDLPLGLLASPLTIAWLLTVTNFYNFMDGTDGLAGGQGVAS